MGEYEFSSLSGLQSTIFNLTELEKFEITLLALCQFQINAILRRSLMFSRLQHVRLRAINRKVEDIDQESLNAARRVIPNIVIE